MDTQGVERKLAAILAADVVGYSRLMGEDETGTLAQLKAHRKELIDPAIAGHHGRIVKTTGDGMLAEFASVVDAVECAVEMQRGMAKRNSVVAEGRRIEYRIGVNLGDIIIDGDDIYGDGVNVAARLEGLAEPGGICLARAARDQVRDKLDLVLEDKGEVEVKNIARPVRVFSVRLDEAAPRRAAPAARHLRPAWRALTVAGLALALAVAAAGVVVWLEPWAPEVEPAGPEGTGLALPDNPSIVVLPFNNMSGDPEQEYFADGITEDITTELARFKDLFVIARNSAFAYKGEAVNVQQVGRELGVRYALEGSVRKSGDKVRISAQLIDAASGHHLWAERYDRDLSDVFAVQDEVTQRIVAAIGTSELREAVQDHALRKPTEDLVAYDYYLQGLGRWFRFAPEDNAEARRLYRRAAELDPTFARAHAGLAWTHLQEVFLGWSDAPAESLQAALVAAQTAVAQDDSDAWPHWALGAVYLYMRRHDQALAEYQRALALNPNDADALAHYGGWALTLSGRTEEGMEAVRRAMRLNPHYPWWYAFGLAQTLFTAGRYDEAIAAWQEKPAPPDVSVAAFLAAAQAQAGRLEQARALMAAYLENDPGASLRTWSTTVPYKRQADLDRLVDGLRKAGMPE